MYFIKLVLIKGLEFVFPKGSYPEVVCIAPNGQYLVSGSADGLIEVWDLETGSLMNVSYQQQVVSLLGL